MKNIKLNLTPAEAYITHHVLERGLLETYAEMMDKEIAGAKPIITANYVKQIIEPILQQLEQQ
jgi:hypothetical protein